MKVYRGYASQAGYGLGNTLRAIIRSAIPIVAPIAKNAGKQLLMAGVKKIENTMKRKKRKQIVPGKINRKRKRGKPRDIFK